MEKLVLTTIMMFLFVSGCSNNPSNNTPEILQDSSVIVQTGIPSTAQLKDEDEKFAVYLDFDGKTTNDISRSYLWVLDKRSSIASMVWADSSYNISNASIIPYTNPCRILVEGCSDMHNIYSFIIGKEIGPIMLPSQGGLVGFGRDEGVIIMHSYQYYQAGGRYSKIEAYDADGNKIASMNTNLKPDTPLR
jgi:hypothetical protein